MTDAFPPACILKLYMKKLIGIVINVIFCGNPSLERAKIKKKFPYFPLFCIMIFR